MSEEKEYSKRTLVATEEETPAYKKKSKTASKSNSEKRAKHKHDYEPVIVEDDRGPGNWKYHWAKRCKICGRVDDGSWLKTGSKEGLIKKIERVELQGEIFKFDIFYSFRELKKLFPGTSILRRSGYGNWDYEEVKD